MFIVEAFGDCGLGAVKRQGAVRRQKLLPAVPLTTQIERSDAPIERTDAQTRRPAAVLIQSRKRGATFRTGWYWIVLDEKQSRSETVVL